jgi:cation transport ATPase
MPPLLAAIANAGRHGVLVKSAVVMEQLADVDLVAFDKTGTLTEGTPRVAGVEPVPGSGLVADEVLRLAAAAEHHSEHPLAAAIVAAARERGLLVYPSTGCADGRDGDLLLLGPPLVIGDAEVDETVTLLGAAIEEVVPP